MERQIEHWSELLAYEKFPSYKDEYGPYTQQIVNCFESIDCISWFRFSGADMINPEYEVENVSTWVAAVAPLMTTPETYDVNGHLKAPSEELDPWRRKRTTGKFYRSAAKDVQKHVDFMKYLPRFLERPDKDFLRLHIEAFIDGLLLEIIVQDEVESTYFRELLSWYDAGHFPCGWEGEYPEGKQRVF